MCRPSFHKLPTGAAVPVECDFRFRDSGRSREKATVARMYPRANTTTSLRKARALPKSHVSPYPSPPARQRRARLSRRTKWKLGNTQRCQIDPLITSQQLGFHKTSLCCSHGSPLGPWRSGPRERCSRSAVFPLRASRAPGPPPGDNSLPRQHSCKAASPRCGPADALGSCTCCVAAGWPLLVGHSPTSCRVLSVNEMTPVILSRAQACTQRRPARADLPG